MNELLREKLFRLLSEPSQEVTNEKMKNAYVNFMEQLKIVKTSEMDYSEVYWRLSITRIELVFIESLYLYEQEKKCLKKSVYSKSISSN